MWLFKKRPNPNRPLKEICAEVCAKIEAIKGEFLNEKQITLQAEWRSRFEMKHNQPADEKIEHHRTPEGQRTIIMEQTEAPLFDFLGKTYPLLKKLSGDLPHAEQIAAKKDLLDNLTTHYQGMDQLAIIEKIFHMRDYDLHIYEKSLAFESQLRPPHYRHEKAKEIQDAYGQAHKTEKAFKAIREQLENEVIVALRGAPSMVRT